MLHFLESHPSQCISFSLDLNANVNSPSLDVFKQAEWLPVQEIVEVDSCTGERIKLR